MTDGTAAKTDTPSQRMERLDYGARGFVAGMGLTMLLFIGDATDSASLRTKVYLCLLAAVVMTVVPKMRTRS